MLPIARRFLFNYTSLGSRRKFSTPNGEISQYVLDMFRRMERLEAEGKAMKDQRESDAKAIQKLKEQREIDARAMQEQRESDERVIRKLHDQLQFDAKAIQKLNSRLELDESAIKVMKDQRETDARAMKALERNIVAETGSADRRRNWSILVAKGGAQEVPLLDIISNVSSIPVFREFQPLSSELLFVEQFVRELYDKTRKSWNGDHDLHDLGVYLDTNPDKRPPFKSHWLKNPARKRGLVPDLSFFLKGCELDPAFATVIFEAKKPEKGFDNADMAQLAGYLGELQLCNPERRRCFGCLVDSCGLVLMVMEDDGASKIRFTRKLPFGGGEQSAEAVLAWLVRANPVDLGFPPSTKSHPELPGYELKELLGVGGYGRVYSASRQVGQDKDKVDWCVKVCDDPVSEAEVLKELREFPASAQLVSEFVELLDDRALVTRPICQKFDVVRRWHVRQLLEGLREVHSAGYVHRDIHPGNWLESKEDPSRGILIDWGSAGKSGQEDYYSGVVEFAASDVVQSLIEGQQLVSQEPFHDLESVVRLVFFLQQRCKPSGLGSHRERAVCTQKFWDKQLAASPFYTRLIEYARCQNYSEMIKMLVDDGHFPV